MSVNITELIWQAKPQGQNIQGRKKLRSQDFPIGFYGTPLLLGAWLQFLWLPLDVNSLQKLLDVFLLRNEVVLCIVSVTPGGLYCFDAGEHCFYSVLETVYSVLNLIDYLRFRVPEVGLGTLFEMFGPSNLLDTLKACWAS